MEEKKKPIVIRLDLDRWLRYDDRRHAERTSFQQLGERLLEEWFAGPKDLQETAEKHDIIRESQQLRETPGDQWHAALDDILNSENEVALRAIKSNLFAFRDYVMNVPERDDELVDIAADEKRLAAIDRRLESTKKNTVGGAGAPPVHRKEDARRADSKRARSGSSGKKVG